MSNRVKLPTSLSDADSPWVSFARIPGGGVPTPGCHVTASMTQVSPAVLSVRSTPIVDFPNLSIRLARMALPTMISCPLYGYVACVSRLVVS